MFRFLFIIFSLFFSSVVGVFAQTGDTTATGVLSENPPVMSCSDLYTFGGPDIVKTGSTHEYSLVGSGGTEYVGPVIYTLKREGKVVEVVNDRQKYVRYFVDPGSVQLEANINVGGSISCEGIVTRDISIYSKIFLTLGKVDTDMQSGFSDILREKNIFYENYLSLTETSTGRSVLDAVEQSDILVIRTDDILGTFSDLVKSNKIKPLSLGNKKIYIISNYSRSFLSKVLAASISQLGATKVSLITNDQFYVLVTHMTTGLDPSPIGEELSYEKSGTVFSLSGFLEFLVYAGFSYQLLSFLLSITFVVLVLNILKQLIGFNVFSTYYPILLAMTLVALGVSGTLVFGVIGFFSVLFVNTFTKKIHLLLHAKRALLVSVYVLLFLFILGIDNYFELSLIPYSLFDNSLIIFPFFVMILVSDRIFQDDIKIWSRYGLYEFLQYLIVTGIVYFIFEYKPIQYFLLSYPDVIILVVVLNILVGRYLGLQVFEYFRFSQILRRIDEEE